MDLAKSRVLAPPWHFSTRPFSPSNGAAGGGLVFDVVKRNGTLIERVRLPFGRNLIGFGPGQTVYMIYAPTPQRILLERAQVVRQRQ